VSDAVILPRRAHSQPSPGIVPGGDCGACVLGGALGLSVPETYERFIVSRFGKPQSFCTENMTDALGRAVREGLADRAVTHAPVWPVDGKWMPWGLNGRNQRQPWAVYLHMALDAGYYGIAEVSMAGAGLDAPGPDHWVMLCGIRPDPGGSMIEEILVSCSARHPEGRWICSREFLIKHGGFNVQFVRPRPQPEVT
jgi:hypothetical protein